MTTLAQVARINGAPPNGVSRRVVRPSGTSKRDKVRKLLQRDGILCQICYRPFLIDEEPTIDHIVEISRGGSNALCNLRLAHLKCNNLRSTDPARLQASILTWYEQGLYR